MAKPTVDVLGVEIVRGRVLHVNQDCVVLGWPFLLGARPVVVSPDDLIEEAFAPKQGVEQDFCVVYFTVVEVQVEAPSSVRSRQASSRRGSKNSQ